MKKTILILATALATLAATAQSTAERRTVLEEFSTAKCQYCPLGVEYIKTALKARPDVIWIVHHAGFLTDDITVPASSALTYLYSGGTYAPAFMLDRTVPSQPETPGSPVLGIVDSADMVAYIDEVNSLECHTTVALVDVAYDSESRRLTGRVEGRVGGEFDPEWTRLSIYIVEDSIVLPQASPTGMISDYVHMHAVHGALTAGNGSDLDFADDGSYSFAFDNILPANIVAEQSHLVALVHEYSRGNRAANRVLNATAQETYLTGGKLGIGTAADATVDCRLQPNPASQYVDVVAGAPLRRLTVSDMAGRRLLAVDAMGQAWRLDIATLPAGIYALTVTTELGPVTKRLIVR